MLRSSPGLIGAMSKTPLSAEFAPLPFLPPLSQWNEANNNFAQDSRMLFTWVVKTREDEVLNEA